MAVSLYTNTRPQETHNEDRSLLKRKPSVVSWFYPAKSKMLQIKA